MNMDNRVYYKNRDIRKRMFEYAEGAYFVLRNDLTAPELFHPEPLSRLDAFLDHGFDISRSLWDRTSLIVHLDIEYVNFDFPAEPYIDPERTFSLQRPVEAAIEEILAGYGIRPLHLITGRGHHFVWRIRRNSPVFGQLKTIGRLPGHLKEFYRQPLEPTGEFISQDMGAAFAGLSLVMEYFANRIREAAASRCRIPLVITEVTPCEQERGREMICIDITEYGDPLNTRHIRMPFSIYLKPWYKDGVLNNELDMPPMVVIPLHEMDVLQAVAVTRSADESTLLAKRTVTRIPDCSDSMTGLTGAYMGSDLAAFHDRFYEQDHDPPERWPRTYDRFRPDGLPPHTRRILEKPKDSLLKPEGIRQVVRTLTAMDWHPRHIAGLIRSKYERDHGWGREWYLYDAATRADFYVRLFSADIATGVDAADPK